MRTGKRTIRLTNVFRCWLARTVVGQRTATCFPFMTPANAARMATSVFPYPTSPHNRRSMGVPDSISFMISRIDLS